MNFFTKVIFVPGLGMFLTAHAAIINVPDDFETIQAAIDTSDDGDTVLVAPGTYHERINFMGKEITVASHWLLNHDESVIDSTIIDASRFGYSVVRFDHGERRNTILEGFTLTGGRGSPDIDGDSGGGGIHCRSSSPTLRYLSIHHNYASYGGGIFIQLSSPKIEFVEIYEDSAYQWGGGIYLSRDQTNAEISYTLIASCVADWGGGICWFVEANASLENVTIANNRAHQASGGIGGVSSNSEISLTNCIHWGNRPSTVSHNDRIAISFSDIEGGRNSIPRVNWGAGNIEDDPRFVAPDSGNWRLSPNSGCIDRGNPEADLDLDGTRRDMGALPYLRCGIICGTIFDSVTGEPLADAEVTGPDDFHDVTDRNGAWRIESLPYYSDLIITHVGYAGTILEDIQAQIIDSVHIETQLRRPIPSIEPELISLRLLSGSSAQQQIELGNNGNYPLIWESEFRLPGDTLENWDTQRSYPVSEICGDPRIAGVCFDGENFFISGHAGDSTNQIYVLNRQGELINQFDQPGELRWGMRDLDWDGELIWGTDSEEVFGLRRDGEVAARFASPMRGARCIAYDCDRRLLWISGTPTDIVACDMSGNLMGRTLDNCSIRIYGLAYWPEDPDLYSLYVIRATPEGRKYLYKMNPEQSGDTLLVSEIPILDHQGLEGAFISADFAPFAWSIITIVNDPEFDRLDVSLLERNLYWLSRSPQSGEVAPGERQLVEVSLNTVDLPPGDYQAELFFEFPEVRTQAVVPISLEVIPLNVREEESAVTDLAFGSIFPNPFNSSTTIPFSLSSSSSSLSLSIYDLQGRLVQDLLTGRMPVLREGRHAVVWDGSNLPAGVYLIRLEAAGKVVVAKSVIVK